MKPDSFSGDLSKMGYIDFIDFVHSQISTEQTKEEILEDKRLGLLFREIDNEIRPDTAFTIVALEKRGISESDISFFIRQSVDSLKKDGIRHEDGWLFPHRVLGFISHAFGRIAQKERHCYYMERMLIAYIMDRMGEAFIARPTIPNSHPIIKDIEIEAKVLACRWHGIGGWTATYGIKFVELSIACLFALKEIKSKGSDELKKSRNNKRKADRQRRKRVEKAGRKSGRKK